MKIRVYGGKLDVVNISTESGGEKLGTVNDSLMEKDTTVFKNLLGSKYSFLPGAGLLTSSRDDRTLFVAGNQGVSDYEISVNVKIVQGTSGGILFRMDNYSYTNYKTTQLGDSWQGYYLQLNPSYISLEKRTYSKKEKIKTIKTDGDDSLAGGTEVKVTVRCKNGDISIAINGTVYIEYFDADAYLTGYIGLYSEKESSYRYSSFTYKEI